MKRRRFIALAGAAIAAGPRAVRAQQGGRMRRIGVLMNLADSDPEGKQRIAAFITAMSGLGWNDGANIHLDYRWGVASSIESASKNAAELVALAPDVLLANAPPSVEALQRLTHTVPIVFAAVTDPVALGIVKSLAQPGGNATGFSPSEVGLAGKWLELLKEIAPNVKRVGVIDDQSNPGAQPQFATIRTAASAMGIAVSVIRPRQRAEMGREVATFADSPDGGLIVLRTSENIAVRDTIIVLAAQYRLPAVYPLHFFATDGGLAAYGPDIVDEYRQAAGYVDRILKGAKPTDLPVQISSKFELVLNLKTAKALGLKVPLTLQASADEVIE
jgi:putative ABC transport system substrate-binding protein